MQCARSYTPSLGSRILRELTLTTCAADTFWDLRMIVSIVVAWHVSQILENACLTPSGMLCLTVLLMHLLGVGSHSLRIFLLTSKLKVPHKIFATLSRILDIARVGRESSRNSCWTFGRRDVVSIVASRLMAPMAGIGLSVDWYGIVGAPHYLRIIEAWLNFQKFSFHFVHSQISAISTTCYLILLPWKIGFHVCCFGWWT